MAQVGVLHEVGDLGLGFDPLTEEEQKILEESNKSKDNDNEERGK